MFTAMEHQNRAEKLVQQAVEEVSHSDETFLKTREKVLETAERVDKIKKALAQKSRELLHRLYETFEGAERHETQNEPPSSRAEAVALIDRLSCEPVQIENINKGKGGSFFVALLFTLLALAAALAGGAAAVGLPLKPETFTVPDNVMKILTYIGGDFYYPSYGHPYVGIALLVLLALVVWFMAKGFSMGKAAKKNLAKAQTVKAAADNYCQNRQEARAQLSALHEALSQYANLLETCDIYTDEYNATVRRIIHVEGYDYDKLRAPSKTVIERSVTCAKAVLPLIDVPVTAEAIPSPYLEQAIKQAQWVVTALVEEQEIPMPYIETTASEPVSDEENEPLFDEDPTSGEVAREPSETVPQETQESTVNDPETAVLQENPEDIGKATDEVLEESPVTQEEQKPSQEQVQEEEPAEKREKTDA